MDWMTELRTKLQQQDTVQVSIDGQIWTARAQEDGGYAFVNEFGRTEPFSSSDALVDALQSWYESPLIIVL